MCSYQSAAVDAQGDIHHNDDFFSANQLNAKDAVSRGEILLPRFSTLAGELQEQIMQNCDSNGLLSFGIASLLQ